jgi:hypothetical protein
MKDEGKAGKPKTKNQNLKTKNKGLDPGYVSFEPRANSKQLKPGLWILLCCIWSTTS